MAKKNGHESLAREAFETSRSCVGEIIRMRIELERLLSEHNFSPDDTSYISGKINGFQWALETIKPVDVIVSALAEEELKQDAFEFPVE